MTRSERIRGGLYGLLIGDALGVPYEFHAPQNLPPPDQIEMQPPGGFNRSHRGTPAGTWSDDGAQALALLDSLLSCQALNTDDLAARFLRWYHQGYATPDGRVFDIGNQTTAAFQRLERGVPASEAGGTHLMDNGNGSLMRVLPLALWHTGSDAALVEDAHAQSAITHGHPRSQVICALYCLWARRILQGQAEPWVDAVQSLRALYGNNTPFADELITVFEPFTPAGSGYVVDCLHSARVALQQPTYEQVVRRAIAFGQDTDTTAAVAGGIAGLLYGEAGIPQRWRDALRGRSFVEGLLARLPKG